MYRVQYNQYYELFACILGGATLFLPRLFPVVLLLPPCTPECEGPDLGRGFGFSTSTLLSCACLSWSFFGFFFSFLTFFGRGGGFCQAGGSLDKIDSRDIPNCNIPSVFLHS